MDLFSIDYGGFINNPVSFSFNTVKQIFLFFMFLTFRDFRTSNIPKLFVTSFLGNTRIGEEEVNEGRGEVPHDL
jgi:hypothetical protein